MIVTVIIILLVALGSIVTIAFVASFVHSPARPVSEDAQAGLTQAHLGDTYFDDVRERDLALLEPRVNLYEERLAAHRADIERMMAVVRQLHLSVEPIASVRRELSVQTVHAEVAIADLYRAHEGVNSTDMNIEESEREIEYT